ncbi:hypothetical protein THAOC_00222 [Thalassiosira oceanica]|uniref:Uncharacterized protein n=1 Tax=Thalassiosira oceanica TaxID=159749 RepID=K0TGN6_THAOC|nr:hypothetical protein THAOC_00222 [Thalassiosira oceanica]|eukprot:EJK77913.1 hypothetical protein THAOC_00222 [Thalassiosira oceanica]
MDHAPRTTSLGPSLAFGNAAVCRRSCRAWALASLARPWDNSALLHVRQRQVGGHVLQLRPDSCVRACGTDRGQSDDGQVVCRQWMWTNAGGRTADSPSVREKRNAGQKEGLVSPVRFLSELEPIGDFVEGRRGLRAKRRRPRGGTWSAGLCLCSAAPRLVPDRASGRGLASRGRRPERERVAAAEGRNGAALPGTGSPDVRRSSPRGAGGVTTVTTGGQSAFAPRVRPADPTAAPAGSLARWKALPPQSRLASFKTGGFRRASEIDGAATPRDREVSDAHPRDGGRDEPTEDELPRARMARAEGLSGIAAPAPSIATRRSQESNGAKRERIAIRGGTQSSRIMIAWSHSSSNSRQLGRVSARTMRGIRGDDRAQGTEA